MAQVKEDALRRYVGNQVSRARKMLGVTQVDLAERCGLVDKTIYNVEKGKVDVSVLTLMQIAVALSVPVEYILPPLQNKQPLEFLENL